MVKADGTPVTVYVDKAFNVARTGEPRFAGLFRLADGSVAAKRNMRRHRGHGSHRPARSRRTSGRSRGPTGPAGSATADGATPSSSNSSKRGSYERSP